MVGEAKPMLETFVDYYNHVMVDLRDPRYMNGNDISDAHVNHRSNSIACCVVILKTSS